MQINGRTIGPSEPPYLIAEISGNHCGHLNNAIRLIRAAKRAGADAVKTQCYEARDLTLDIDKVDFICQSGPWKGRKLYELYQKAHTPPHWHKELYHVADQEGITIFSSVFSPRGIDLLMDLGCPAFKVASFEIVDIPLLKAVAATGRPVIISTGGASEREIKEADDATGNKAAFLHCVSEYPTSTTDARLSRLPKLAGLLGRPLAVVGLSDHSLGTEIAVAATALGATIIEKHLKLGIANGAKSEDDAFSLAPDEFIKLTETVRRVWQGLQDKPNEPSSRQFRRSLYAVADIKAGETYTHDNIRSIRPGYGMPSKMLPLLIGRKAKRDFKRGDPLS